ncbi:hypothetical protein HanIR_Chr06g0297591 [Helianthus annuus]|nr:hypothetical protein HanIR_Chr06g0297591 [Helianthus annuus]
MYYGNSTYKILSKFPKSIFLSLPPSPMPRHPPPGSTTTATSNNHHHSHRL